MVNIQVRKLTEKTIEIRGLLDGKPLWCSKEEMDEIIKQYKEVTEDAVQTPA